MEGRAVVLSNGNYSFSGVSVVWNTERGIYSRYQEANVKSLANCYTTKTHVHTTLGGRKRERERRREIVRGWGGEREGRREGESKREQREREGRREREKKREMVKMEKEGKREQRREREGRREREERDGYDGERERRREGEAERERRRERVVRLTRQIGLGGQRTQHTSPEESVSPE